VPYSKHSLRRRKVIGAWIDLEEKIPKLITAFAVSLCDFAHSCKPPSKDKHGKTTAGWPVKLPIAVLPKQGTTADNELIAVCLDADSLDRSKQLLHEGLPQTRNPRLAHKFDVVSVYDKDAAVSRITDEGREERDRPSTAVRSSWDIAKAIPQFKSVHI